MNPNQNNNLLTGAPGENSPLFRGPEYYRNLNTTFGPQGNVTTQTPTNIPGSIPTNQPPVIPINVATGTTQPLQLPPQPTSTAALNATAQSQGYVNMPAITNFNQLGSAVNAANQNFQTAQQDYIKSAGSVADLLTNLRPQLEQQYNIEQLTKDRTEAQGKMAALEDRYRIERETQLTNPNLTADMKQARLGEIARKEAFEKSGVAIDLALKENRLKDAKDLIDRQYEIQLEPLKFRMEFYQNLKNDYKDVFNQSQNRLLDNLARKEERAYQSAQKNSDMIKEFAFQAAKDGNFQLSSDILNSKNLSEALQKAALAKASQTGIDPKIAKDIAESKVGQKVNSSINFKNALSDYKKLYKEYYDAGNLKSVEAISKLNSVSEALKTQYALANGQGAISDGDRASYNKIISSGVFLPNIVLKQLDALSSNVQSTINNDIKFLDAGYQGQATNYFAPQLQGSVEETVQNVQSVAKKYPEVFKSSVTNFFSQFGRNPNTNELQQIANYISNNQ